MRVFLYLSSILFAVACAHRPIALNEVVPASEFRYDRQLAAVLPMVRVGLGEVYPTYLDEFSRANCKKDLLDHSEIDMCAYAIGSDDPRTHVFCAHISTKALIIAATCGFDGESVRRYARFAVRYALEMARDGPCAEQTSPKTSLIAAIAISTEFLSGSEKCVAIKAFKDEMLLVYERAFRQRDFESAHSAITFLLRYGSPCLTEVELGILLKIKAALVALR